MAKEKLVRVSEAKAKLIEICNWFGGPVQTEQDKLAQAVVNMCIEEIDKMEPAQKWIPVTERLPEKEGRYLCVVRIVKSGAVYVQMMNGDRYGFSLEHIYNDDVTHWMPLPEPPKGE